MAALGIRKGDGGLEVCSGTLIAPTVVLTAAHCLVGARVVGAVFFPPVEPATRLELIARDSSSTPSTGPVPSPTSGSSF